MIWEYSAGVPRKINILCDNAFLIGYGLKKKKINPAIVQEAAEDLKWRQFSDTKVPPKLFPPEIGDPWVETKSPKRSLKLTAAMIIAGLIIFAGSFLLNESGFQFAKLTGFTRNVREPAVETVHPEQGKEQVQIPQSDTTEQAVSAQMINAHKVPKKDVGPETRIKNDDVSYLSVSKYHLMKEKSFDFIVQDLSVTEARVDDKEKSNLTVPVKKEEIIRRIVVKKGDTLHRIIAQTYGAYDDMILNKVQQQNPKIIDPDLILAGQTIKLPKDTGERK
ncbi:MAG: LysM peptidoglycan-binding domain-containing protein [Deltaproteobacteria bacterium]|nr:LysM peptidoglycan-binding domain-containing protein [Deltaproteobacteria bacterium]